MVDPQPYDLVRLHSGTAGITDGTTLIIADTFPDQPGTYVVWHLEGHPDHLDWAAAITRADIAALTRSSPRGDVQTWTPAP